jgi:hypothetical protein
LSPVYASCQVIRRDRGDINSRYDRALLYAELGEDKKVRTRKNRRNACIKGIHASKKEGMNNPLEAAALAQP